MSQGISMNRRYDKHGWDRCNRPKHGSKQVIQQPIECISSDSQCLKFVTSARALVASCLNSIGRKVACFEIFSADGFIRGSHCCVQGLWHCWTFRKTIVLTALEQRPPSTIMPDDQSSVGFVSVQPSFLQLLLLKLGWSVDHWIFRGGWCSVVDL